MRQAAFRCSATSASLRASSGMSSQAVRGENHRRYLPEPSHAPSHPGIGCPGAHPSAAPPTPEASSRPEPGWLGWGSKVVAAGGGQRGGAGTLSLPSPTAATFKTKLTAHSCMSVPLAQRCLRRRGSITARPGRPVPQREEEKESAIDDCPHEIVPRTVGQQHCRDQTPGSRPFLS